MEDTRLGLQERAVLGEYERALRLEAYGLANRIELANPDLKKHLDRIVKKVCVKGE